METFVTFLISLLLAAVGIGILVDGVERGISFFKGDEILQPAWIALAMAVISILIKKWLIRYTRYNARKN
ncbi:MAG: cation transporter [Muribaculaceae bacterium]|nr:cation transporter [Muribaculaceae bacterium]